MDARILELVSRARERGAKASKESAAKARGEGGGDGDGSRWAAVEMGGLQALSIRRLKQWIEDVSGEVME